ncbi:MAG TPA: DUF4012 domain-containing protein [Candidatus Woesebacteria bacterium]|nr:DUF4012 domain-containing protein [Candidatus Woesebacteria bacterium]
MDQLNPVVPPVKIKKTIPKFVWIILIILSIITVLLFFFIFVPGKKIYSQVKNIKEIIPAVKEAINDKDLDKIKESLNTATNQVNSIEINYKKLAWTKILPIVGNYYKDGQQALIIANQGIDTGKILIQAIEPYKDFLGAKGSSTSNEKTTEDRIAFLTESVEGLIPYLDQIEAKAAIIQTAIEQIDPDRYPEEFRGIELKSNIIKVKDIVDESYKFIKDGKPIIGKISWLLGKDSPRKYLVIFQNDGELRPSGGFWTAYSTLTVKNGKVIPGTASNIYDLDDKIASKIPAPRLIKSYHIGVPYLNLRDNNLSPDFPTDAQIFLDQYYKAMGKKDKFDAVISIDTNLLVDMVKVLGKLDTRVGTFTAEPDKRCNGCPSIIYDLEWIAGRPRNYIEKNRKDFMNPLMSSLLSNIMGSEKTKMPSIIEAGLKNINEKHVMFYFPDDEIQTIGNLANITGKIVDVEKNVDYFHLNDANFASAKSNIFITQKIKHDITIKNNVAEHKISVTYENPAPASNCNLEKGDLCLNASQYRDLFRFYVPIGSKLTKMTGSEVEAVQYEELNKQVFEGFYGNKYALNAKSSIKTSIQYTSSVTVGSTYTLLLQKQPGTKPVEYELTINGEEQPAFQWVADKTIKFSL